MSTATNRNFAAAQRERNRRVALSLDDPSFMAVTGDPAGDAFFGSLRDQADAAAQRGMGFRADLSSIGRDPNANAGFFGSLNPLEQQSQKYQAMQRQGDADVARSRAEQAVQRAMLDAQSDSLVGDLKASDQERQLAQAFATPERASVTTETTGPDGKTAYSIRNAAPETERERMLATAPPPLRAQLQAQWAAQDAAAAKQKLEADKQAEIERHNRATETGGAATVTDEGIDIAARNYLKTGVMPPLGMGDKTTRQRIINRSAELGGADADIASNKAAFGSDSASLKKLQGQRDAIGAFEETAKKNMDVFLGAAKNVADTGSPLLNQPVRLVSGKMLGGENQAEYDAARAVLLPEIARIITNPNLTGVLSDSARQEVSAFNPETATLGQTIKVMRLLKQDMANRTTSLDDAISTVRGRMSKQPGGGDKPVAAKAGSDPLGIR